MHRRTFGLNSEYGLTCTFRGQRRLPQFEVAGHLFRDVISPGRASLPNGPGGTGRGHLRGQVRAAVRASAAVRKAAL